MYEEKKKSKLMLTILTAIILLAVAGGAFLVIKTTSPTAAATSTINSNAGLSQSKSLSAPPDNILQLVIELRTVMKSDVIRTAEIVTQIETLVAQANNQLVANRWESLALCVARGCDDNVFFEFILTLALESKSTGIKNPELVANIITANRYWGTDNVVKFSEAVNYVNKYIKSEKEQSLTDAWNEAVQCNAKCSEMNDKIFVLLKLVS